LHAFTSRGFDSVSWAFLLPFLCKETKWAYSTRRAKKVTPLEKLYISQIVAGTFTKFAEFTDEDSIPIPCKLY